MRRIQKSAVLLLALLLCTCGKNPTVGTGSSSPLPPDDSSSSPGLTTSSIFNVEVQTAWEGTTEYTTQDTCRVSNSSGATVSCDISIPEGLLYYSSLRFSIVFNSDTDCTQISFSPFYYRRSVAAGYIPVGRSTAIDCSADPADTECWGGAGTQTAGFPTNTGNYFLPLGSVSPVEYTYISANAKRVAATGANPGNRWTVNNLSAADRLLNSAHYRAATGIQDWEVSCENEYAEPLHTLTITINDTDSTLDQHYDWY